MHAPCRDFFFVWLGQADIKIGDNIAVFPLFFPNETYLGGNDLCMVKGKAFDDNFFHDCSFPRYRMTAKVVHKSKLPTLFEDRELTVEVVNLPIPHTNLTVLVSQDFFTVRIRREVA